MKLPLVRFDDAPGARNTVTVVWPPGLRTRPIKRDPVAEVVEPMRLTEGPAPPYPGPIIPVFVSLAYRGAARQVAERVARARGLTIVREFPDPPRPPFEPRRYRDGRWFHTNEEYWAAYPRL